MDDRVRLSARPEAPWAFWSGIAGGLVAAALAVKGIFESGSSTAAIGLIFVPFIAIAAMVFAGIWGLALGCVAASLRRAQQYAPALLLAAWVFALAVPAAAGWEISRGLALQSAVRAVPGMTAGELDDVFARSRWNRDRFFLGALALNPAASPALLEAIAALPDARLYEPMGSLWDVMGRNTKGIAVMRLVAAHSHTRADTLARLADGPHADRLRHALVRLHGHPRGMGSRAEPEDAARRDGAARAEHRSLRAPESHLQSGHARGGAGASRARPRRAARAQRAARARAENKINI
jgi:hypothetical protein